MERNRESEKVEFREKESVDGNGRDIAGHAFVWAITK